MRIKQRTLANSFSHLSNFPSLLQRIYAARGIQFETELDKSLDALLPFDSLIDIDRACLRLEKALRCKERILIIGDFDADGATATALAVSALREMGAYEVDFLVPNRFDFGYGLTPGIVKVAKGRSPHLIITVDNGIASIEGVDTANAMGIDVLVTDHHLPPPILPKACAIVNPNQEGDPFLSKGIAGVGVIFYVMLALRRHLINTNWFNQQKPPPNMAQFLDLVALGTVADVVPLDQNNRIMVAQGVMRIREGRCRPGIRALIDIAGRDFSRLRESDLGFSIAPRLNAAGRLEDMSLGIDCLLCPTLSEAHPFATRLDELNQERRVIETDMKSQALVMINQLVKKIENTEGLPVALCMVDPSWHQGVIGILAGRLKERYHRPVIAFSVVSPDELKGSARSILKLNIRDVLAAMDQTSPGLITKFGGHAMAAGLTIPASKFRQFRDAFVAEVEKHIDKTECCGEIWTDGPLKSQELTLDTASLLAEAGPWGQQFPEPCFYNTFDVIDQKLVGRHHLKLVLRHPENTDLIDAIAFNIDSDQWPNSRARQIDAVYKLSSNFYRGKAALQLIIETLQAQKEPAHSLTVLDYESDYID